MNITEKLLLLVKKYSKVDDETYPQNTQLAKDLGIDSIMLLQLIVDIEDEFDISISDEELDSDLIGSFGGLEELVKSKISEKV